MKIKNDLAFFNNREESSEFMLGFAFVTILISLIAFPVLAGYFTAWWMLGYLYIPAIITLISMCVVGNDADSMTETQYEFWKVYRKRPDDIKAASGNLTSADVLDFTKTEVVAVNDKINALIIAKENSRQQCMHPKAQIAVENLDTAIMATNEQVKKYKELS